MKYIPTYNGSLPMILYRSLETVMPIYREVFTQHNITEQQWRVLRILWRRDSLTANELAKQTLLAPNSLVGIIDRLEKRNLVRRQRSETDRRIVHISPTEHSRTLESQVIPQVDNIHTTIQATVTAEEWQTMETILNKISSGLNHSPTTTGGEKSHE